MFEVLFEGGLLPGFELPQVKQNLKALFKASDEQVERMFLPGQMVVLRNQLDEPTALKYERALTKAGVKVVIRDMATKAPLRGASAPTAAAPVPQPAPAPSAPSAAPQQPPVQAPAQAKSAADDDSRIDTILEDVNWSVAPVGSQMADGSEPAVPDVDVESLDWDLAPVGSDMGQLRPEKEEVHPDISHLKLVPPGS